MPQTVDHVRLSRDGKSLIILDQSRLPNHSEYIVLASAEAMYEAIKSLRVRGAPAIGIFAGFAMYVLAQRMDSNCRAGFDKEFYEKSAYLNSSRPTAVNLSWALKRMEGVLRANPDKSGIIYAMTRKNVEKIYSKLSAEGFPVTFYHAGLPDEQRAFNQDAVIRDATPIMIATRPTDVVIPSIVPSQVLFLEMCGNGRDFLNIFPPNALPNRYAKISYPHTPSIIYQK